MLNVLIMWNNLNVRKYTFTIIRTQCEQKKNEQKCNTQQRKTQTMLMCVLPKAVNSALFYENWRIDVITNVGSACLSTSVTSYYHTFESV